MSRKRLRLEQSNGRKQGGCPGGVKVEMEGCWEGERQGLGPASRAGWLWEEVEKEGRVRLLQECGSCKEKGFQEGAPKPEGTGAGRGVHRH